MAKMRVTHIARDDTDLLEDRNVFQPAPVIEGIILRQRRDPGAASDQFFDQPRTDEAIGPSDENTLVTKLHSGKWRGSQRIRNNSKTAACSPHSHELTTPRRGRRHPG